MLNFKILILSLKAFYSLFWVYTEDTGILQNQGVCAAQVFNQKGVLEPLEQKKSNGARPCEYGGWGSTTSSCFILEESLYHRKMIFEIINQL